MRDKKREYQNFIPLLSFDPAYQELNGNKSPQGKQFAYCINKTLSNENQVLLNTWNRVVKEGFQTIQRVMPYIKDQFKIDVCEKYAKF